MTAITQLEVSNFLRLREVDITPAPGEPAVIAGRNAQGKSSLLRAIEATLGGKAQVPATAVHTGEDSGWTRVTLDNGLVVERRYTAAGATTLHVTGADGVKITRAQAELDALLGALTFEPMGFANGTPKEQRKILARLVGLDLDAVESERRAVYDARTVQGREVARLSAVVETLPEADPGLPASKVDMGELLGVLNAARETVDAHRREREALAVDETRLAKIKHDIAVLEQERDALAPRVDAQIELVRSLADPDLADLESQVASLSATNEAVAARDQREAAVAALSAEKSEQTRLTTELERIDAETQAKIEQADLPVAGLGFSSDGITLNGTPFSQASAAETIRVCFAVAAAERPGLNIALVRDGSLLDEESLSLITAEAASAGCQLWIERVGDSSGGFVIEDGVVASTPLPVSPLGWS